MKVVFGLLVIGGIVLGIVYFKGGTRSFDPTAQGQAAKALLSPGMTWQKVIAAAGPPQRYSIKHKTTKKFGGQTIEDIEDGVPAKFERPLFEQTLASGSVREGFRFMYVFSGQSAFSIHFDPAGVAEEIVDDKTVADLLDKRK